MTPDEQATADANTLKVQDAALKAEHDFASGFSDEVDTKPEPTGEALAATDVPPVIDAVVPPVAVTPQVVDQSRSVADVKQALDQFSGQATSKMAALEQTILELQRATPVGQTVEITDADFAELTADIPDMTPKLVSGLKRVFERLKGVAAPATETADQFEARVNRIADKRIAERRESDKKQEAIDTLTKMHPTWQAEVGPKDSDTEYRKWLATQPYHFATEALSTWDANTVADALNKFHDFKKGQAAPTRVETPPVTKTPASSTRVQRLAEAVTPKGGAPAPVTHTKTAEEEFAEGFKS